MEMQSDNPPLYQKLLQLVYTRFCTLRELMDNFKGGGWQRSDIEKSPDYQRFLESVIVGTTPKNADLNPLFNHVSQTITKAQFQITLTNLNKMIFDWKDKGNPKLPCFDLDLYFNLYCSVGDMIFRHIFSKYGLFTKVGENECYYQIGGEPFADLFFKAQKEGPATENTCPTNTPIPINGLENVDDILTAMDEEDIINWKLLLYNRDYRQKNSSVNEFDKIINRETCVDTLIQKIWPDRNLNEAGSPVNFHELRSVLEKLIENYKQFDLEKSCNYHCPVNQHNTEEIDPIPVNNIVSFSKAIIYKTIPQELLGSRKNVVAMQDGVAYILKLGLGDQPSIKHVLGKMRINQSLTWINVTSPYEICKLFKPLLLWIINYYIFERLARSFYVTPIDGKLKKLFYFPKLFWRDMEKKSMETLVQNENYRLLHDSEADYLLTVRDYKLKKFRFIPKKIPTKELRLILKNSKTSEEEARQSKKDLYMWNYCLQSDATYRGCSILHRTGDQQTFQNLWRNYIERIKRFNLTHLHFVKLDISDCFTSVQYPKLSTILNEMAAKPNLEQIWLRPYFIIRTINGKSQILYRRTCGPRFSTFSNTFDPNDKKNQKRVICHLQRLNTVSLKELVGRTMKEVRNNVIKFNGKYYLKTKGLRQGGHLSVSLCNIYFGHMESHTTFKEFISTEEHELEFLVRFVDDYLFVTPHRDRAINFKSNLDKNLSTYGAAVKDKKSMTNFDCKWSSKVTRFIDYCGFLIDTQTLELSIDHSRDEWKSISHRLTVIAPKGLEFIKKMMLHVACVSDKLILFDGMYNRKPSIIKNVYRLFLMVILKLHSAFSRIPNPNRQNMLDNPEGLLNVIVDCIKRITQQLGQNKTKRKISWKVKLSTVRWICLTAAVDKLSVHSKQYSKLLRCLKKRQTAEEGIGKLNTNKKAHLRKIIGKIPSNLQNERRL